MTPITLQTFEFDVTGGQFWENDTSASALQNACSAVGGYFCSQGGDTVLNFTSNGTKTDLQLEGRVVSG